MNNKAQKTSFAILCGYMGIYDRMYWQEVNTNSDYYREEDLHFTEKNHIIELVMSWVKALNVFFNY